MSAFEERYKALNPAQREAVDALDGPVMVIAGPGTGKTELLGLRVANILRKDEDVAPANILCLTFTDAAAWNVRERLVGLIGRDAYRVAIHTFHSFGVEIINRYPEHFYRGAAFSAADEVTQIEILENIFEALDHGNPLRAEYNEQFSYLRGARHAIEQIKKAGLTPDEFDFIIAENKKTFAAIDALIQPVFSERISKKLVPRAEEILEALAKMKSPKLPGDFAPFPEALARSLREALDAMDEYGTAPLTQWKARWTSKGEDKLTHLADIEDGEKIETLAHVYREYAKQMHAGGYYDYNDMILDAIAALEKSPALRAELTEKYHYILVDEFQDTNDAQMRLVRLLTQDAGGTGAARPNIMVVGDDDQAIFKFQGAEISNILDFQKIYPDPKLVVLTSNYRSTQDILDLSRKVIRKGIARLENLLPNLKKDLIAANKNLAPGKPGADGAHGEISGKEFPSRELEYQWLAKEAARLIAAGVPAQQIAIIAREHRHLESIVPYFHAAKIPVAYEREENVLRVPHILQLITMATFVDSIMRKNPEADDLLPEILNYSFWGLDRVTIWELSLRARAEHRPWLGVMRESGGKLAEIANFFLELGSRATSATAEEILHELIGGPQLILPEDVSDDGEEVGGEAEGDIAASQVALHEMFSPFRSFYFGRGKFDNHRADYLRFLSALRSFVRALRDYHPGQAVSVADMVAFVQTHIANRITINNVDSFANAEQAVQLMVAHKAKGLEFEAVFIVNCEEDVWADSGHGRNLPLPANLPIGPAGDTQDDQLRLFYVALTRAKRLLYLTWAAANERGKKNDGLSFLAPQENAPALFASESLGVEDLEASAEELLIGQWNAGHIAPFIGDEKALLAPVLKKYQLSITHLQNFLNVAKAGPVAFLEKNLLRFPEPINASGAFGSAVHETIKSIYAYAKIHEGKLPSEKDILAWFKEFLMKQRLNKNDFSRMLKRGEKALPIFYKSKEALFSASDIIECDFSDQGVELAGAMLTGKIDRMTIVGEPGALREIIVSDFKTGDAVKNWEPYDAYEKIKVWQYRGQLIFYKLLIENSREFGGSGANAYVVNRGIIQFVEPSRGQIGELMMPIEAGEVERLKALIAAVYKKIQALDFPDISKYPKDIHGIRAFEEDLLG